LHRIVITIFYNLGFIIDFGAYFWRFLYIPKFLLAMSILTPGFRGEFFLYEALNPYILMLERVISELRSNLASLVVKQLQRFIAYMLKRTISFLSEDCLASCNQKMNIGLQLIKDEVVLRRNNHAL
jgi:hypothetical protein